MTMEYGAVAITGDAWLNERAQAVLDAGLPTLPLLPGEPKSSVRHARRQRRRPIVRLPRLPRLLVREFNPALHPHDPRNGRWISIGGGINAPDFGALYKLDNFEEYDKTYDVFDESSVNVGDFSFTAISMQNGEAQLAVDTESHRYVLSDTDAAGMRDFADTLEKMLESFEGIDQETLDSAEPDELVDYLTWDDGIQIGYDAAGDFRITTTDTDEQIRLPELTPEQIQELIDALIEQADNAEQQEE